MSPELSQLIALQELDLEIQRLADRLFAIPVERQRMESEFEKDAAEFLELKSTHERNLNDRKHLEAEITLTQQHHDKYQQDKMRVRNEKEYAAVLREIDAAKKQIGALETEVLKLMEEIEKQDSQLQVQTPEFARKRGELEALFAELEQESESAQARSTALHTQRAELAASVPHILFATYERMSRTKRGQALAEVRDGICTACRMKVRPKIYSDVRKGDELVTCESCSRILYYKADLPESAEAAKTNE